MKCPKCNEEMTILGGSSTRIKTVIVIKSWKCLKCGLSYRETTEKTLNHEIIHKATATDFPLSYPPNNPIPVLLKGFQLLNVVQEA